MKVEVHSPFVRAREGRRGIGECCHTLVCHPCNVYFPPHERRGGRGSVNSFS